MKIPYLTRLEAALTGSFLCAVAVLAFYTLRKYPGTPQVYIVFTLIFNALFLAGFRENRFFFDTFSGLLLWLGFWFKLSGTLLFLNGRSLVPVGNFSFSGPEYDRVLLVASCGAAALLAASFLRGLVFAYPESAPARKADRLDAFYLCFRRRIWFCFLLAVVILAALNAYFGFYQRGLPPRSALPLGLSAVVTLALLFGLTSISAFLLNLELRVKVSVYMPVVISMLECFFSNISMLSRGMIMNGASLILGLFAGCQARCLYVKVAVRIAIITLFLALFAGSGFFVNYMRNFFYSVHKIEWSQNSISPANVTPLHVFVERWVGLEGVMSVTSYGSKGWPLMRAAWAEQYAASGTSFYDRTIITDSTHCLREDMDTKHFINLPGIIAFFYYPGSGYFLFAVMLCLGVFAALLEYGAYIFSGGNLIFCALIGQVVAGRFVHFGYSPARSYMLIGGILAVMAMVYALNRFGEAALSRRSGARSQYK